MSRRVLLLTWVLLSCGGSGDSTEDPPPSCPAVVDPESICTTDGMNCPGEEKCYPCGYQSYKVYTPLCTCTDGQWLCSHQDCGPVAPGTYSDPACTTLNGTEDAGPSDADDESEASCPAVVDPESACTANGMNCPGDEKCYPCGYQSYKVYAPLCTCTDGQWLCSHQDCGPMAPGTYSDSACTILNTAEDAGQ